MALVLLKNNWFAPGGRRFRRVAKTIPVEIPDELVPYLPSTAVLLDNDGKPADRVDHNLNKIKVPEGLRPAMAAAVKLEGLRPAMAAAVKLESEEQVADTMSQFQELRDRQDGLAESKDIEAARARTADKAGEFQKAVAAEKKAAETEEAMAGQAPALVDVKVAEAKATEPKSKVRKAKDNRPPVMTA